MKRIWAFVLLAGCAGGATPPAADAFRELAELLREHRDEEAWGRMSDAARARVTREDFLEIAERDRDEMIARAEALAAAPVSVEAVVPLRGTAPLVLSASEDGWRIRSGIATLPSARTPEEAAQAFGAAVRGRSLDSILRGLSRARRREIEGEMVRLATALGDTDGFEVVRRTADRATVRLAGNVTVELVLENGEWRVDGWE